MQSALTLLQHLPPSEVDTHLDNVLELAPEVAEELLPLVDQPLKLANDPEANKQFLCSDFNRDVDSFRSPFSNKYFPPLEDGVLPSDEVRKIEEAANDAFETYCQLYYDSGYSSVYLWDIPETTGALGAAVLIKKEVDPSGPVVLGAWDSIHVFTITPTGTPKQFEYNLSSVILISMKTKGSETGKLDLEGTLKRAQISTLMTSAINTHVSNMGSMVETMENRLRDELEGVYFDRTKDIITGMHRDSPEIKRDAMIADLRSMLLNRQVS
ncbi:hypothetical protein GEMRC1_001310 [Eukaryota sp. GEM-RC1]